MTTSGKDEADAKQGADVVGMTNAEYVAKSGMTCPACGEDDSVESAGSFEVDGRTAWQQVACLQCNATWVDVYRLAGFDSLEAASTSADEGEEAQADEQRS